MKAPATPEIHKLVRNSKMAIRLYMAVQRAEKGNGRVTVTLENGRKIHGKIRGTSVGRIHGKR